jgi:hypothetical protein
MRAVAALVLIASLVCLPGQATAFTHADVDSDTAINSVRLDTNRFSEAGSYVDVTIKARASAHVGVRVDGNSIVPAVEHAPGVYVAEIIRYSHAAASSTDVVAYLQDGDGQSWSRAFTVTETLCAEVHQTGVPEPQQFEGSVAESDDVTAASPVQPQVKVALTASAPATPAAPTSGGKVHYDEIPLAPTAPAATAATTDATDVKMVRTSDNPYFDNSTVELLRHSYADNGADAAVDSSLDASRPHTYNNGSIAELRNSYGDDSPAPTAEAQPAAQLPSDPNTGLSSKASNDPPIIVQERSTGDAPSTTVAPATTSDQGSPPAVSNVAPPGYSLGDPGTPSAQATAQAPAPQYLPYSDQAPPAVAPPVAAHR